MRETSWYGGRNEFKGPSHGYMRLLIGPAFCTEIISIPLVFIVLCSKMGFMIASHARLRPPAPTLAMANMSLSASNQGVVLCRFQSMRILVRMVIMAVREFRGVDFIPAPHREAKQELFVPRASVLFQLTFQAAQPLNRSMHSSALVNLNTDAA